MYEGQLWEGGVDEEGLVCVRGDLAYRSNEIVLRSG